ncbi:MAG: hypothetical protein IIC23_02335 [Chloroflexi bacterium]|nr:hypothetical protein [Chloroflexota bacterium]
MALESGSSCVGQPITLDIVLSEAPSGFSGMQVFVTVADPNIAEIQSVIYNVDLGFVDPTLPSDTTELRAVDTGLDVQAGATNTSLVAITLNVLSVGLTQINIDLGPLDIGEEDGSIMVVDLVGGVLTVN